MKTLMLLIVLAAVLAMTQPLGAERASKVLSDFQDPADLKKWTGGDSGNVETSLAPRSPTDSNILLKVVFKGGDYPGIVLKDTPEDWSPYEALSLVVWTETPFALNVRIDDSKSTDYKSRFNKVLKLEKGRNLCQLTAEEVARVLNVKDIRTFILFAAKPPSGLTMWFDDFVLGPRVAEQVAFIPYDQRKDLQPRMDVVTPHLPLARDLAKGPLAAFVISGITNGREVVELMQRCDLKVSLMTWDSAWDQNTWGMGDFYGQRGHAFDRELMRKYITSTMQGPEKFDVMILPTPVGWKEFPAEARAGLLKRVKENGEGLVLIHPFPGEDKWPEDLLELSALVNCASDTIDPASGYLRAAKEARSQARPWQWAGNHPVIRGVPLEALPYEAMVEVKYELAKGAELVVASESKNPIVAVKKVGKGRVVTCAWEGSMITPTVNRPSGAPPTRPYRYQEVMYDLIARCALWAAGRDLPQQDASGAALKIEGENADPCLAVRQVLDDKGKVLDWTMTFAPPGADGVAKVEVKAPKDVQRGKTIGIDLAEPKELRGKNVEWLVAFGERAEGKWRTLESTTSFSVDDLGTLHAALSTARIRQILGIINVEGKKDGKVVARGQAEVVVTPPGAVWDDYEVFMWPVDGLPFLREMEDVQIVKSGSTGVMETGWASVGRMMRWSRAGLRVLPHNVDVRPLHIRPYEFGQIAKQYKETGDRKFLIRPKSYADPEFLAQTRQKMKESAAYLRPFFIPAYVLCDEPSLTSYREEFDFDFHPANVQWFRRVMKEKFGEIDSLNKALGTSLASFDEINPPTGDEARKAGNWGLWNEWRAHNDTVMAEGYKMYRDALRQEDPNAMISISGTQTANPFDGFDWSILSPHFDAMNGYGYGEQERQRMSFHDGPMKNAKPAGYGNKGKGVAYQLWTSLAEHGCGHVLFWWVSFRNPDLTWCQSAVDYRKGFLEMRAGIGRQYQLGRRHTSPVAIQYSMNSLRATWTRGREYHSALQQVTDALVAAGFDPVFISDEQIAAGDLVKRRFKAVFLPSGLSLGRGDKKGGRDVDGALARFIEGGGAVVATDEPAFDEFLQPARPDAELVKKFLKFGEVKGDVSAAMAKVQARPWTPVRRADGTLVPGLSVTVHKLDGPVAAYMVTLLRKPVGQKEVIGADGVLTYQPDPSGGNEIEPCQVDISGLGGGEVFAIRTGKQLPAQNGRVAVDMPSGEGMPLAVLPYGISKVELQAKVQDRDLVVSWRLVRREPAESKPFAPHAVRVEATDAGGAADPALSRNATSDDKGAGTLTLPLAMEDGGRELKIAIRDILTGARAEATVRTP